MGEPKDFRAKAVYRDDLIKGVESPTAPAIHRANRSRARSVAPA